MNESDPRWRDLAAVLVGHATGVRSGERVLVAMREPETFPLAVQVHEGVVRACGLPQTVFASACFDGALLRTGSDEQIGWVPELESLAIDWADASIWLRGSGHPVESDGISPERFARHRAAMGAVSARRTERTRWTLVRVPCEAFAQTAGLPLAEATDRFFRACLIDWQPAAIEWRRVADRLAVGTRVRITGPGTDLAFSTAGRRWVVGDGRINVPDGEVYTAPVDDSGEGEITFASPQMYAGQTFEGVRLRFRSGKVVEAAARRGEAELQAMLGVDAGARRVGAECGGVNRSAIHWDLVQDLRDGGRIEVDGEVVFRDGATL